MGAGGSRIYIRKKAIAEVANMQDRRRTAAIYYTKRTRIQQRFTTLKQQPDGAVNVACVRSVQRSPFAERSGGY